MEKRSYPFKREFYPIGSKQVEVLLILVGHGYDLQTYCCGNCGEIFVLDREQLFHRKVDLETMLVGKQCPTCDESLKENLLAYPEFVVSDGKTLKNPNEINRSRFDDTEIVDVNLLS